MRIEPITESDRKSAKILLKRDASDSEILLLRSRFRSRESKSYFLAVVRDSIDSMGLEYFENEIHQSGKGIYFSDFFFSSLGKAVNVYREKRPKDAKVRRERVCCLSYLQGLGIDVLELDRHDIKDGSYVQKLNSFLI